jgi:hypothetical protein
MLHLEPVYRAFARYPFRLTSFCEHCLSWDEAVALRAIPLRQRGPDDVVLYSLLNTIGDERDFKHLLPRLLELFPFASFERSLVIDRLARVPLEPDEAAVVRRFFQDEVKAAFLTDADGEWLEAIARHELQPWLESLLGQASVAPRWYARLINEVGTRHASSAKTFPFTEREQVVVDWLLTGARFDLLERAFFEATHPDDLELFSLAHQTLEFWAG